jgi:hypothetical protein
MPTKRGTNDDWTLVIQPESPLTDLQLKELWLRRRLIFVFVRRDFIVQYKQTILGPLWHLIQPLITTLVFTVVFGKIAKIPTDGTPPFLFYMSGIVLWTYFAGLLTSTAGSLTGNALVFSKIYFPRLIIPLSNVFARLLAVGIGLDCCRRHSSLSRFSSTARLRRTALDVRHTDRIPLVDFTVESISLGGLEPNDLYRRTVPFCGAGQR